MEQNGCTTSLLCGQFCEILIKIGPANWPSTSPCPVRILHWRATSWGRGLLVFWGWTLFRVHLRMYQTQQHTQPCWTIGYAMWVQSCGILNWLTVGKSWFSPLYVDLSTDWSKKCVKTTCSHYHLRASKTLHVTRRAVCNQWNNSVHTINSLESALWPYEIFLHPLTYFK